MIFPPIARVLGTGRRNFGLLAALVAVAAAVPVFAQPQITSESLATPAAATGASGSSLAVAPDGTVWLTWLETEGKATALRFATLEAATQRWSPAGTIARGADWFVNWADFPALTVGPGGHATAVWFVNNPADPTPSAGGHDHHGPGYRALLSRSQDAGRTWSSPEPLTRESDSVEFVSLATLADGRVLAAWLDGRAKKKGGRAQQLYARLLGAPEADRLVDDSVCDCCQTTLTAFPDGTALLAYRGRTAEEVRDLRVTRFRAGAWEEPRPLHVDGWKFNACPVNGPHFASDGGRVAVAWFTAADNDPRVLASLSMDAGTRFLRPLRLTEAKPAGRVSTVILHDTAFLVSWVDVAGVLWLSRISPDFVMNPPVRLSDPAEGRIKGFPRLALLRDYVGGDEAAQILITYTAETSPTLRTRLVTVPEAALVRDEQNCDCTPGADQLRGFPIRGVIAEARPGAAGLRVRHFTVPGLFEEGTREFLAAPEVIAGAGAPGGHFLGRVERRAGAWWLISIRPIASPPR